MFESFNRTTHPSSYSLYISTYHIGLAIVAYYDSLIYAVKANHIIDLTLAVRSHDYVISLVDVIMVVPCVNSILPVMVTHRKMYIAPNLAISLHQSIIK